MFFTASDSANPRAAWTARGVFRVRGLSAGLLCLGLCLSSGCEDKAGAGSLNTPSAKAAAPVDPPTPPLDQAAPDDKPAAEQPDSPAPDDTEGEAPQAAEARDEAGDETSVSFFGVDDEAVRHALLTQPIAKIKRGRGGRSLGFKITLADGTKGYYKPEQTFSAANWYAEVAAYHLDRMLGIGRVPPVISRRFAWKELRKAAGGDKRRKEVTIRRGSVRGAFVWWIPGGLRTMPNWWGWERWMRNRHWPSTVITPFQRPRVWKAKLDRRKDKGDAWLSKRARERRRNLHPKPDRYDRAPELSDLVVFDYLTRNIDRWGGNNANVLIRGKGGPLVFLDNGAGFAPGPARPSLMEARLHVIHRFRKSTIEAARNFDMKVFKARLAAEPLAPILSRRNLDHLQERLDALVRWADRMSKRFGEKRVYPWEDLTAPGKASTTLNGAEASAKGTVATAK